MKTKKLTMVAAALALTGVMSVAMASGMSCNTLFKYHNPYNQKGWKEVISGNFFSPSGDKFSGGLKCYPIGVTSQKYHSYSGSWNTPVKAHTNMMVKQLIVTNKNGNWVKLWKSHQGTDIGPYQATFAYTPTGGYIQGLPLQAW